MGKLSVFNFITINGYFKGLNEDIGWHVHGNEQAEYASEGFDSKGILLFGRVTYQLMASYWPTQVAAQNDPVVAAGMNRAEKVVFSKTMTKVDWHNTRISLHLEEEVRRLKEKSDQPLTVLGSGSLVAQLTELGLVDEFQFMVDPIALAAGTTIFEGLSRPLHLQLTSTRTFKSGTLLLTYIPV